MFLCPPEYAQPTDTQLSCLPAQDLPQLVPCVQIIWLLTGEWATACDACVLRTGRKDIKLVSLKVAGKEHTDYDVTEKQLTLSKLPQGEFEVEIDVDIKPQARHPSSQSH